MRTLAKMISIFACLMFLVTLIGCASGNFGRGDVDENGNPVNPPVGTVTPPPPFDPADDRLTATIGDYNLDYRDDSARIEAQIDPVELTPISVIKITMGVPDPTTDFIPRISLTFADVEPVRTFISVETKEEGGKDHLIMEVSKIDTNGDETITKYKAKPSKFAELTSQITEETPQRTIEVPLESVAIPIL